MNTYALLNAGRIIAGPGSIESIKDVVADLGASKVLIITDKGVAGAGLIAKPRSLLEAAGVAVAVIDTTPPEPDVNQVNAILDAARPHAPQLVVGIGGGSAMDVAKIVAVLLKHDIALRDLLSGKAKIVARGLPTLMVPTTAGTGSETTPNSIILVPEDELKVGIVSPKLMPDGVIVDPELTVGLPPAITASTGMDALCHAIECYTSKKGNPFSEMLALKAISLIARSIRTAFNDGKNLDARHDMLLGAMYGGMCIATLQYDRGACAGLSLGWQVPHRARDFQRHSAAVRDALQHRRQRGEISRYRAGDGARRCGENTARSLCRDDRGIVRAQPRPADSGRSQALEHHGCRSGYPGRRRGEGDALARQQPASDGQGRYPGDLHAVDLIPGSRRRCGCSAVRRF